MLFITALSVTDACAGAAGRRSDESTHEGEEAHGQGAGDAGGGGGAPAEARGKFCHVRTLPGRRAPRGGAPPAAAGAAFAERVVTSRFFVRGAQVCFETAGMMHTCMNCGLLSYCSAACANLDRHTGARPSRAAPPAPRAPRPAPRRR